MYFVAGICYLFLLSHKIQLPPSKIYAPLPNTKFNIIRMNIVYFYFEENSERKQSENVQYYFVFIFSYDSKNKGETLLLSKALKSVRNKKKLLNSFTIFIIEEVRREVYSCV